MYRLKRSLVAALLALLSALPAGAGSFGSDEVLIQCGPRTHRINAEIALTPQQREQGLMGRTSLASDAGMLFIFEADQVVSMWMRDTKIPLDMLFLSADGRIVSIAARVVPLSDDVISSPRPVRGVLELAAGAAQRLGLSPGDRVLTPYLVGEPFGAQSPRLRKP